MSHVSIRARLIFLSVLLLAILAASSGLLIRELIRHSQSLGEQARLVSVVRSATTASKHFGDLKYWLTDLAITQLASSQQNAAAAKARFDPPECFGLVLLRCRLFGIVPPDSTITDRRAE